MADRIRRRVLNAIQGATGASSIERVLAETAKKKPLEYLRLVISFIAPDKATTKEKAAGGLTLEAILSDLERRRSAVEAHDARLIPSQDDCGG